MSALRFRFRLHRRRQESNENHGDRGNYLGGRVKSRFSGKFFNEFAARFDGKTTEAVNKALLPKKIIGGLPLGRFYPELADSVLLCATEMSRREDMDRVAAAIGIV